MSTYALGPLGVGTVSGLSGASAVTGTDSDFTTQFQSGDQIGIVGAGGVQGLYTVATVTDATHLTIVETLSETYAAATYYGLRSADQFVQVLGIGMWPASVPVVGDPVRAGDGHLVFRGYPKTTWTWGGMTVAEWAALRAYVLDGAYSGPCYVRTRDADDGWAVWVGVVDFPQADALRRASTMYLDVALSFLLVSEVG